MTTKEQQNMTDNKGTAKHDNKGTSKHDRPQRNIKT
jgi:hypothetical protein